MFGDADPFSDFFHTFFGGAAAPAPGDDGGRRGRGSRGRAARQGRDVEHELELGLEDAFHGTTRRLSMTHDGQAKSVDVRIPAGVGDGSRVRVAGEGEHGVGGAKAGDLYLRVRLAAHPAFERKGRDLYTRVPVPLTTAVLGGEADVATLAGKPLRLKVPPGTQNAQVFRLKGHGMPSVGKPDQTGDLYATADVQLPRELTPEQREHFEALQKLEKSNARNEYQQIHREGPRSGRRRHRARAPGQQPAARAGASARGAHRAARGDRPQPAAQDERGPGRRRARRRASC